MNRLLIRALVDCAYFFDAASDDVLDPDVAVAQMEDVGATLQQLSEADRTMMKRVLDELAVEEERSGRAERASFCRSFMQDFGLIESTH